jgi:CBS domain containing-hemolysin-like protein
MVVFSCYCYKLLYLHVIILLTAEFYLRCFSFYANELLKFFAIPCHLFYLLFWGISWFCIQLSDFVLKTFSSQMETRSSLPSQN